MRGDDDEEEESSVNATRYPCMPSLVALQQMRNRLHLAHLGKKLMKWTAMATGRELRRLAGEIDETYKNFAEDMRSAFMLLARGRYFYPNMNNTVLENVALAACVTVATSSKSISGVKVLQLEVIETGFKPYPHLGIEKGGQTIQGAKKAWLDLLKRLIIMLQQRTSFYQLEQAHKSATKKMNVLGKIVIPRTKMSIRYILNELEEIAREEFFRLKKILEVKRRKIKGDEEEIVSCPICLEAKSQDEIAKAKCIVCGALLKPGKAKQPLSDKDKPEDDKLEEFKAHIKEIIDISKDIEEQGILSESVEEFLKTAETLKEKLESKGEIIGPIPSDIDIKQLCEKCKKRFDEEQAAKLEEIKEEEAKEPEENKTESVVCLPTPLPEIEPIKTPLPPPAELCELHAEPPYEIDLGLGTFETEIQEITKIVRIKNEDGTITEEKKVVKIKREIKAPVKTTSVPSNPSRVPYQPSDESSTSNPYPGKKTVGMMAIESNKGLYFKQSAFTNVNLDINSESTMTNDSVEQGHSSTTARDSVSDIDFEQKLTCDSNNASVYNIRRCSSSEEEFKSILSYIGRTSDSNEEDGNDDRVSYLSPSEMKLLSKIFQKMPSMRISKSVNNVFVGKLRNINRSNSFHFDIRYLTDSSL
ncbi:uncharacterized protein LOC115440292 isoform X4 [Manduca sexta]|uniref:uncharacterized protein LOC115440292 isoform X4 n=1 Tax=Manduca sexta TaxID=7130 RepID=UPI0018902693|nr:uncharacterized protein LOC115440292 isoform X4 [Manduca sexta]